MSAWRRLRVRLGLAAPVAAPPFARVLERALRDDVRATLRLAAFESSFVPASDSVLEPVGAAASAPRAKE